MKQELNQEKHLINKKIGKRIAHYRQEIGLTQAQLAQIVGFSTSWIQQIEYGNTQPSIAKIIIFANALGVTPQQLINEHSEDNV